LGGIAWRVQAHTSLDKAGSCKVYANNVQFLQDFFKIAALSSFEFGYQGYATAKL